MELDHLGIADIDRKLISLAVNNSDRVYLAPMDKGLSGSIVWQARWNLPGNRKTRLHVFKIGALNKLEIEAKAIENIAAAVDNMSFARLYKINGEQRGLLRLEFQGDPSGNTGTFSLRNYIRLPRHSSDHDSVCAVIDKLYKQRMKSWHYDQESSEQRLTSIDAAFPKWRNKIDLERVAREIGYVALDLELQTIHGLCVKDLCDCVDYHLTLQRILPWGPIHGDLHAANVNLDRNLDAYLIDYGDTCISWRALDFVILEAAIKFAASPAHAPVTELLQCEAMIDQEAHPKSISDDHFYGNDLRKVLAAGVTIRKHCRDSGAESDAANYRAGLTCVAAAFTSIEWLVNRRFLFHSIAYNCKKLERGPRQ